MLIVPKLGGRDLRYLETRDWADLEVNAEDGGATLVFGIINTPCFVIVFYQCLNAQTEFVLVILYMVI